MPIVACKNGFFKYFIKNISKFKSPTPTWFGYPFLIPIGFLDDIDSSLKLHE